ncbi:hypothetical protein RJ641_013133, partial [Dillenia turbinata]
MASVTEEREATAVFMAFGTKGDVFPIAAIAAAFACDQKQYRVILITHSSHEMLSSHLEEINVACIFISSPPVLSILKEDGAPRTSESLFSMRKRNVTRAHRQECFSAIEKIFGHGPSMEGDFIVINFFALEGWSLAELFGVCCLVAAPYVVPYSAPSSFERHFRNELPHLYDYLQDAPTDKVGWKDVMHWMWPLFTEDWGSWRSTDLNLSACPFTDPVTGLPVSHHRLPSPLLLYGFSRQIVECPGYWPSNVRVCGFWFLPSKWQFSCDTCSEIFDPESSEREDKWCPSHTELLHMGFLRNPEAFLRVLQIVLDRTNYRFIFFTAGYEPFDRAIQMIAAEASQGVGRNQLHDDSVSLYGGRLFCFSGAIPYNWLFRRCLAAIHHGGSGSTAAALHVGIPQVLCPFVLDQFYWAEKMFWLGVAPEPLKRNDLFPEKNDNASIQEAAKVLLRALHHALSPEVKASAADVAKRLSSEDGVLEAVKILKEEANTVEMTVEKGYRNRGPLAVCFVSVMDVQMEKDGINVDFINPCYLCLLSIADAYRKGEERREDDEEKCRNQRNNSSKITSEKRGKK